METCQFEILLTDKNGIATQCKGCGNIHVGYGNFMITFSSCNFSTFCNDMEKTYHKRNLKEEHRLTKNIFVKTPTKEVSLLFCLEELEEFICFLKKVEDAQLVKRLAKEVIENKDASAMN